MTSPILAVFEALPKLAEAASRIARTSREDQRLARLIEFQEAIIHSNAQLGTVQQEVATLAKAKNDLEQQIVRMEQWELERARYKLHQVEPGITLHALTEAAADGDPPHWLCPRCYGKRQKAILNRVGKSNASDPPYRCGCGYEIVIFGRVVPAYA